MGEIPSVVLTGGPCALKSTTLNFLRRKLENYGFAVYVAAEAATFLIGEGLQIKAALRSGDINAAREYQREVIRFQVANEDVLLRLARREGRPAILLCDRGIPDSRAYLEEGREGDRAYRGILREVGLNPLRAAERYKGVIKLTTAADGALEFYTLANNVARDETPAQAIELDRRIEHAYLAHPHLRVVGNATGAEGKKVLVLKKVCSLIGIPQPIEVEKKYQFLSLPSLGAIPVPYSQVHMEQAYLQSDDPNAEVRVRRRSQGGDSTYYRTEKRPIASGKRSEIEEMISEKEYRNLISTWRDPTRGVLRKVRISFLWEGQYFELDIFQNLDRLLYLLEIELTDERQEVILPNFLGKLKEVTGQPEYGNYFLARLVR